MNSPLRQAPAKLVINCARCGRHGEYVRDQAVKRFGNISQADFLFRVVSAECALMKHPGGTLARLGFNGLSELRLADRPSDQQHHIGVVELSERVPETSGNLALSGVNERTHIGRRD